MKLYSEGASGNSYKVRVLLALLDVAHELIEVDMPNRANKKPEFFAINPRGQVPALIDGNVRLWDSGAILQYLARKYGGEHWLPSEPAQMAQVMQWVMLAGNEIQTGLQYGRRGTMRGVWSAGTLEQCQVFGRIALNALSSRLKEHDWLAHGRTTIADVACFPYVDSAPEMGLTPAEFPGVAQWLARCRALPRWPQDWPPDLSYLRARR
jgi:glutathione S-transferase